MACDRLEHLYFGDDINLMLDDTRLFEKCNEMTPVSSGVLMNLSACS